jgi:hypothetical protein
MQREQEFERWEREQVAASSGASDAPLQTESSPTRRLHQPRHTKNPEQGRKNDQTAGLRRPCYARVAFITALWRRTGQTPPRYLGASPSKKSVARMRQKVNDVLVPGNRGTWPEVRDRLNSIVQGWSNYFSYGTLAGAYQAVDHHVADRVRHFLRRRRQVPGRGARSLADQDIYGLGRHASVDAQVARP